MSGVRIIIRNPPGGDLVELGVQYIYRTGWELVQRAEEGSGGRSTLVLDDPDFGLWDTLGLNVGGRQQIRLVDIDSDRIVAFGFVGKRAIRRKYDNKGHPLGRAWTVDVWDANAILQRRILTHKGAKRPRESDVDRINALFDLPEWGIIDTFLIGPSETTMSKHDYRGMTVGQYIADCGQMARKNWWVDIVDIEGSDQQTFWYGRDTRNEYASTLAISNDLADIDGATIFAPSKDTEYTMDPERVYDGIWATGEKQSIYRRRPATAEVFGLRWDTSQQWPTVHEHDRLVAKAESMLDRLKDEQEIVTTAIEVPAESAHLIRAGMRIPLKLTHIPALEEFTDCRVLSRGIQPISDGSRYRIPLTLEPIGPADAPLSCSTALSSASTADETDGTPAGSVSISITPEEGEDFAIIAGAIACHGHNDDFASSGAWTDVYAANYPISTHPEFLSAYQDVSSASGTYDFDATYTPDEGTWGAVLAAIRTSASAPVQTASTSDTINTTVNLASATDADSMLVMVVAVRDDADFPAASALPNTIGWTRIAQATSRQGLSQDVVAILVACPGESIADDVDIGFAGGGHVTVMEWAIT